MGTRLLFALGLGLCCAAPNGVVIAASPAAGLETATPIKHLVVVFMENTSFDSYFGVYPVAENPPGSLPFGAKPGTPSVNGLSETLLFDNPNQENPFRIDRFDSYTCDQNHLYTEELEARNQGLMNMFVEFGAQGPTDDRQFCVQNDQGNYYTDMGYFDGNTVTAFWNYAQHFAMSDNFFATTPGGSARGALNLAAADVYGVLCVPAQDDPSEVYVPDDATLPFCNGPVDSTMIDPPSGAVLGTVISDPQPYYDVCSQAGNTVAMAGRNLGDLLTDAGITWGWFQGGFADCERSHPKIAYDLATGVDPRTDPVLLVDYTPHWNPFQYWQSTANPMHLPPSSIAMIGRTDQARHLYDLEWFWKAVGHGNLPAVSFLKPPTYQTGHPGLSEPIDQQVFLVRTLNRLQRQSEWRHMAVMIAWDDSDGWADHVMPPVVNSSATSFDTGTEGQPLCGGQTQGPGARCAYGPRLPFLVVSPYAKSNYVGGLLADQTSITHFIEDNWLGGERISDISFDNIAGSLLDMFDFSPRRPTSRLFLGPHSGEPIRRDQ